MARLRTIGYEIGLAPEASGLHHVVDGGRSDDTEVTIQTGVKRSGASAVACNKGTSGLKRYATHSLNSTGVVGRGYWARAYVRFSAMPTVDSWIFSVETTAADILEVYVTTAGKLRLIQDPSTQIGSDSAATLVANTWYRIELYTLFGVGSVDATELRLDGVTVASGTGLALTDLAPNRWALGWQTLASDNNLIIYFDDFALNDDQGASQNSWPGDCTGIVLCKPISIAQAGSWVAGAGGAAAATCIDNTPPVGIAGGTDTSQLETTDSSPDNATDECRVNLTTYTNAGIGASDTIPVLQAVVDHGEGAAAGTKTGRVYLQSNPAGSVATGTFTFGDDAGANGTWPTNWRTYWGSEAAANVIYNPSPTKGSSPVLALRKVTTTTAVGSIDFAGIYVEYVAGAAGGILRQMMAHHGG